MLDTPTYRLFADLVLVLHAAVVVFVVGGLAAVLLGNWRGWRWVNGLAFRLAHLGAIAVVVADAWLGFACPLTVFEGWLRRQAGDPGYGGGFVAHWLQRLIYYEAPAWVFLVVYTLFAVLVVLVWWRYPPRRGARQREA